MAGAPRADARMPQGLAPGSTGGVALPIAAARLPPVAGDAPKHASVRAAGAPPAVHVESAEEDEALLGVALAAHPDILRASALVRLMLLCETYVLYTRVQFRNYRPQHIARARCAFFMVCCNICFMLFLASVILVHLVALLCQTCTCMHDAAGAAPANVFLRCAVCSSYAFIVSQCAFLAHRHIGLKPHIFMWRMSSIIACVCMFAVLAETTMAVGCSTHEYAVRIWYITATGLWLAFEVAACVAPNTCAPVANMDTLPDTMLVCCSVRAVVDAVPATGAGAATTFDGGSDEEDVVL